MNRPYLYFQRTNQDTGETTIDRFSGSNTPGWWQTPLAELEIKAQARLDYWNAQQRLWHYSLLEWRVEPSEDPLP